MSPDGIHVGTPSMMEVQCPWDKIVHKGRKLGPIKYSGTRTALTLTSQIRFPTLARHTPFFRRFHSLANLFTNKSTRSQIQPRRQVRSSQLAMLYAEWQRLAIFPSRNFHGECH